jgi:hypothetical protein
MLAIKNRERQKLVKIFMDWVLIVSNALHFLYHNPLGTIWQEIYRLYRRFGSVA